MTNFFLNIGINPILIIIVIAAVIILGFLVLIIKWYKKPIHGKALVRSGYGGTKVAFERGIFVIPVLHRIEVMDITLKTMTISRIGTDGLICKDNIRADIKVAFFVRVNNTIKDATDVAYSIGCQRASAKDTLESLFDAKFSEALKTIGKRFDFVDLYNERDEFRKQILALIGRNLNGYFLDDCAIDYLEQTPLESMKERNILDAEGIKKIIELTSAEQIKANQIENDKLKTIKKQDVEARETILTYERQLAEKEETQKREIANIKAEESAKIKQVDESQRELAEKSRISAQEAIEVAEQNKERQVLVALWNKEKTNAVEQEKTEKEKMLFVTEREKIVTLAQIAKDKEVEAEKAKIQEIIRERVKVQKDVVIEEQKIKDTEEFATAERKKKVAIISAEEIAEQALVKEIKNAEAHRTATQINGEAQKIAAEFDAKQKVIEADTAFAAAGKEAEAIKILAEAEAARAAAHGKSEAQVIEAKASANLKDGETKAKVLEMEALAEAKGIEAKSKAKSQEIELITEAEIEALNKKGIAEANVLNQKGVAEADVYKQKGISEAEIIRLKAEANEKQGLAEAKIIQEKLNAEAKGIENKAAAMKKLDGIGKEHEEFKLQLQKDKEVEIAQISILKDIADAQAKVISEAVKAAKIDIVGGETMFFDKIIGSITRGKTIDTLFENSQALTSVKDRILKGKEKKGEAKQEIVEEVTEKTIKVKEEVKPEEEKGSGIKFKLNKAQEKIMEFIEKNKFLIKDIENLSVIDALENLLPKMTSDENIIVVEKMIHKIQNSDFAKLLLKRLGL